MVIDSNINVFYNSIKNLNIFLYNMLVWEKNLSNTFLVVCIKQFYCTVN